MPHTSMIQNEKGFLWIIFLIAQVRFDVRSIVLSPERCKYMSKEGSTRIRHHRHWFHISCSILDCHIYDNIETSLSFYVYFFFFFPLYYFYQ
jgi:hypothetical protein